MDLRDLLAAELRVVPAPVGLWSGVVGRIEGRAINQPVPMSWAFAAALVFLLIFSVPFLHGRRELDLGPYIAPVQAASLDTSASAIAGAPAHFQTVSVTGREVAGYQIAARREARVGGERVEQLVLTAAGNAVALFISSPKVRLEAGANRWVDGNVEGVACKRLNCPRVRTAQFPCFQQTCVLICKACSDRALSALMSGVGGIR